MGGLDFTIPLPPPPPHAASVKGMVIAMPTMMAAVSVRLFIIFASLICNRPGSNHKSHIPQGPRARGPSHARAPRGGLAATWVSSGLLFASGQAGTAPSLLDKAAWPKAMQSNCTPSPSHGSAGTRSDSP